MMHAEAVKNVVAVLALHSIEGQSILETSCSDYHTYALLPTALLFEGRVYGKTGWNSDTGRACFKTGVPLATAI